MKAVSETHAHMWQPSLLLVAVFLCTSHAALAQVDTADRSTSRDLYARAQEYEDSGRISLALAAYKNAIELDPQFFDAYFSLSGLYAHERDYHTAIEILTSSLKARPNDYSVLFNLGLYHEYLRQYDAAIASYGAALSEEADCSHFAGSSDEARAHAFHYRGRAYQWFKQDYARAIADYTNALRLHPDVEMVHYRRACAYHSLKEYAKAHTDFAVGYKLQPDYSNLLNAWAWQLATCPEPKYRNGRTALIFAKKTNDLNTLAAAFAETGAYDDAVDAQQRAVAQLDRLPDPEDIEAAERRKQQRFEMQTRLATYQAGRPHRDE